MAVKGQFVQRFGVGAKLALAALSVLAGLTLMAEPGLAQYGFGRSGVFDSFFGPFSGPRYSPSDRPADFTRAPPPRKVDTPPSANVLVLGDSMADWLAYGLEDALSETPDLGVIRKHRAGSGLIHYDTRNDSLDWARVAREAITTTKPKFVVMMLGLNDRQPIRERPLPSGGVAPSSDQAPPLVPQDSNAPDAERGPDDAHPSHAAESQSKGGNGLRTFEFRTEEWAEFYIRRIDATIAALKSAGVPVFWVGLPSVRGPKSTSDMLYLNDLYRTRAEKAGITYIDVWDGFVDENGRYAVQGPDFEGQIRRLRVSDGVHFTKAGARKLAHYLEREIRRTMTPGAEQIAIPATEPQQQMPSTAPGAAMARPLSGPVLPLSATARAGQDLLGANDSIVTTEPRPVVRALVNGDPLAAPAGRSDDFTWPRRGIAPFGTDPVVATTTDPVPVLQPPAPTVAAGPAHEAKAADAKTTKKASTRTQRRSRRAFELPFGR